MKTYFEELLDLGVAEDLTDAPFTFEDMFDEFIAGDCQKTWPHDRTKSVGASEAFGCIRKNWFSKRGKLFGYERDTSYHESWGATRRGDIIENYQVVPAVERGLARRGMELIMAGDGQDTIVKGTSSATLDGLIINAPTDLLAEYDVPDLGTDCCVLEMKSFDPRINIVQEKDIHRGQTQMQMGMIRETTPYKPNFAVVLYVNASWLDDIRAFVVEYDDDIYEIGKRRNEKVFTVEDPAELGAEGKLDGMCSYCPYEGSCQKVSAARVPAKRKPLNMKEIEAQDHSLIEDLDAPVHELALLKREKKTLERKIEDKNEEVRQSLIAANESRAVGDGWKVSYTAQKGRKTISKDLMIERGLDPEDFMTEGAGFEKLTVTMETPQG